MKFRNLILGRGTHEGSAVTELIVALNDNVPGFVTAENALTDFRDAILHVVEAHSKHEEQTGECSHCTHANRSPLNRYCGFCGRRLAPNMEDHGGAETCSWFTNLFDMELHEFSDWEEVVGWRIGWLGPGSFVRVDGFDRMLEEWNPADWKDNLGEGRSWWQAVLSDATYGDIVAKEASP